MNARNLASLFPLLFAIALSPLPAGAAPILDYFIYDDVYDEKLARNRPHYGVDMGNGAQTIQAGYQRDFAGKMSGDLVLAGSPVYGFSGAVQAVVRFRRDERFRPSLYAGPAFVTGARYTETVCACDSETPEEPHEGGRVYGQASLTSHPALYLTMGTGLQIRIWRGFGAEYKFGRDVRLLGRKSDFTSDPEVAAVRARDVFGLYDRNISFVASAFYEF